MTRCELTRILPVEPPGRVCDLDSSPSRGISCDRPVEAHLQALCIDLHLRQRDCPEFGPGLSDIDVPYLLARGGRRELVVRDELFFQVIGQIARRELARRPEYVPADSVEYLLEEQRDQITEERLRPIGLDPRPLRVLEATWGVVRFPRLEEPHPLGRLDVEIHIDPVTRIWNLSGRESCYPARRQRVILPGLCVSDPFGPRVPPCPDAPLTEPVFGLQIVD